MEEKDKLVLDEKTMAEVNRLISPIYEVIKKSNLFINNNTTSIPGMCFVITSTAEPNSVFENYLDDYSPTRSWSDAMDSYINECRSAAVNTAEKLNSGKTFTQPDIKFGLKSSLDLTVKLAVDKRHGIIVATAGSGYSIFGQYMAGAILDLVVASHLNRLDVKNHL